MSLGSSTPAAPLKRPPRVATIIAAIIAVLLFFGPMLVGVYTDWTPLTDRPGLFPEDIDRKDPWQFRNVLVR